MNQATIEWIDRQISKVEAVVGKLPHDRLAVVREFYGKVIWRRSLPPVEPMNPADWPEEVAREFAHHNAVQKSFEQSESYRDFYELRWQVELMSRKTPQVLVESIAKDGHLRIGRFKIECLEPPTAAYEPCATIEDADA